MSISMQSLIAVSISSVSEIVLAQEFYLFCFFSFGFLVFRTESAQQWLRSRQNKRVPVAGSLGRRPLSRLKDDFACGRYEEVLEGWAHLEKYTAEGLSLVVTALLALGRPDDVGVFVTKAAASLPQLQHGLHEVVAAVVKPSCEVRRQHVSLAVRQIFEQARQFLNTVAMRQLLLALAGHNDEMRVSILLANLSEQKSPATLEFLGKVVQSFLACKNLDAALGYLQQIVAASSPESLPHDLILEVIRASAETAINDDPLANGSKPRAWDALDSLTGVEITGEAKVVFLEWSARQTPVDVAMATRIEKMLRQAGPLPIGAYDALVRVHASSAGEQSKALAFFDEFVRSLDGSHPSESSLIGMISSCVEARNCLVAEHVFSWTRAQGCCTLSIFSATIKVLAAAKEPAQICRIYESVANDKDLVLDEGVYGQIITFAAQAGRSELARSLFNKTKQPNAQHYVSLMRACGQAGKVEDALQLLRELQKGGEVDTMTFNCALDVCASNGQDLLARKVLKEMQAVGRVDVVSYNIMLKMCMAKGAPPKAADEVIREMRQRGLQPNTATFNSLLGGALSQGDFTKAWRTIDLLESSGQAVDAYTVSILFKGYKHQRRTMNAESIDRALTLVKKHAVKVDEVLVNVALEACFALRDTSRLKSAMNIFQSRGWFLAKEASMHTYGVLIKAHGLSQNLAEAWRLWDEVLVQKDAHPSEQLYGHMLDVLVTGGRLEDALVLFEKMKAAYRTSLDSHGFAVAYAMIIRGFAQRKNCAQALQCYEEMKSHGTKASLIVLNTLIDACSRVGDMASASNIFQDMLGTDCSPDLITYSTLIKGFCISDLDQALQLFTQMKKKGISPDAIVFNSLLDGCAKKQMPSLCEQVIRDMEKAGVVPSNHSASILIKLYGRCKNLDAAFRVLNDMPQKYGFKCNNPVYTCLMAACISNGSLQQAMQLRVRMLEEGICPDEKTYSTLLRGTLKAGSVEQCVLLIDEALDQKVGRNISARSLLDEELVKSVMILIRRRNLWDSHGSGLLERLRSAGVRVICPADGARRQPQQRNGNRSTAMNQHSHATPRQESLGQVARVN